MSSSPTSSSSFERVRAFAKRAWPHAVAAFVVFHLAANALDVIPEVSQGMNKRAWADPRVRTELSQWAARLGTDRKTLEDELWSLGMALVHVRAALLTPFSPYLRATGQHQSWAMFIAGTHERDSFQVRARDCDVDDASCDWRVLYDRNRDDDDNKDDGHAHDFMRNIIESPRVRSAVFRWGWPQLASQYERGCKGIARRAFAAFPDVVAVQCRFERSTSPSPHAEKSKPPEWGRAKVVRRADLDEAGR